MTRPLTQSPEGPVPSSRIDTDWHIDDEGVLHTGRSAPFAKRTLVACDREGNHP